MGPQQELGALRKSVSWTSRLIPKASRDFGQLPVSGTGAGGGVQVSRRGGELGDGVRCGSLAGVGTRRIWGFPERAEPGERWRCLRRTGRLSSESGTIEMSFGLLRVFSIVVPFLYVGTLISKNFAALLEEHDIFVPEDDDDGD
ncbi:essential MCU regulator, mitochondrial isoform X1 [Kogia breviceps]|uniref:essential MCU regulator, mitochondrial isoform X1 n=1 Tax=Kogia breviceps TaxID=27615 RepID=UPI0034D2EC9A